MNLKLGTEWNHIEAALAHALGLPMLIIHHHDVCRGVFDRGAFNTYLHRVDMADASWAISKPISGALSNWKGKLAPARQSVPQEKKANDITPTLKWGMYKFGDEPGLFCPVCYQKEGLKIPCSRQSSRAYQCPNCRAILS